MDQEFVNRLQSVSQLMHENKLGSARALLLKLEQEAVNVVDEVERARQLFKVSRQLSDLGAKSKELQLIESAIQHYKFCVDRLDAFESGNLYFCLGTAHLEASTLEPVSNSGVHDSENRRLARRYFRRATNEIGKRQFHRTLGNCLVDKLW